MHAVPSRAALTLALALTALAALPARAADPAAPLTVGAKGQVTLGAERLFGFEHASEENGPSFTSFRLASGSGVELFTAPYSIPRLALDYFVADRWSLGLGAGLANASPESGSSFTSFVLNPRVGYAVPVGERVTFWPVAGLNYVHLDGGNSSAYELAGTLEARILAAFAPHFGFQAGAALDLGLGATNSKITQVGLECGLTGWF